MTEMSIYEKQPANPRAAIATLRELLEKQKGEIAKVLPEHLDAGRLIRIAVTAVSKDSKLMKCTPMSVLRCVMQAGELGLEPGGPLGDSFLVPYKNKKTGTLICTLIPGYRGLISLARRSGQVLSIEAHAVREKDKWEFRRDQDGTFFTHVPSEDAKPGEVVRVYAVARLKNTPLPAIEIMPLREIFAIMASSQSEGKWGPWKDHFAEMARKSAIRRLSKYLPMSVEFADALDREDRVEKGLAPEEDLDIIDVSVEEPEASQSAPSIEQKQTTAPAEQKQVTAPKKDENPLPGWADIPKDPPKQATKPKPSKLDELIKLTAAKTAPEFPKQDPVLPCNERGARPGTHYKGCPMDEGDEIQGREPGQEG